MNKRVSAISNMRSVGVLALVLLAWPIGTLGQTSPGSSDSASDKALEAHVPPMSLSQITIPEAATQVLFHANVPGGVIISSGCSKAELYNFEIPGTTLDKALDLIINSDHTYRWTFSDGVVHIFPLSGIPDFLETVLPSVDSTQKPQSIGAITSAVWDMPEVQARLSQLKLVQAMMTIVKGINQNPPKLSLALHNSSLLQVLDALAAGHGQAVWEYHEFECRKPREYQLRWRKD